MPALRHRVLVNFEAEAEGVGADTLVSELLESVVPEAALKRPDRPEAALKRPDKPEPVR